jgi:hypothetical protein
VPVKIHMADQPQEFGRFGALWTPTLAVLDPDGEERYRFVGYLPAEDFLARLRLGLAHRAAGRKRWEEAEGLFREVVECHPDTEAAPEALYWAGAARYQGRDDPEALVTTARAFGERYVDSEWAEKASVWGE